MLELVSPSSLHFEERGTGFPIVNLHGWPAEHGQMMAMMEPLFVHRQGWRRIYVDLPGMGLSPGAAGLVTTRAAVGVRQVVVIEHPGLGSAH